MKFKDWTRFEKTLLIGSILIVSLTAIVFNSDVLTPVCSIVGIITALLLAKGKYMGQVFGVLICLLYSIVSFRNEFYGEVIVYLGISLPMYVMGIISWIKHQEQKTNAVKVNKISKKEWIIVSFASIFVFVGIYFLLKAFNTNQLFVSSLSVLDSLFSSYLLIRRSKYGFYFYVVNDIVLWGIPCIIGSYFLIPMLMNPVINLINDIYAIYNWKRLEKIQETKKKICV